MNIKEAMELKTKLELEIMALMSRFQTETGLGIDHVAVQKFEASTISPHDKRVFLQVRVDVKL